MTDTANIINLYTVDDIDSWLKDPNNEYIGRGTNSITASKWGNPFKVDKFNSRQKVIGLYQKHIQSNPKLAKCVAELKGKKLGCWCSPQRCHGEILHHLAGNVPLYKGTVTMSSPKEETISSSSSNSEVPVATKKLLISNLGTNITAEDLVTFFGLERDAYVKANSVVELSENAGTNNNSALLHIPEEIFNECCGPWQRAVWSHHLHKGTEAKCG